MDARQKTLFVQNQNQIPKPAKYYSFPRQPTAQETTPLENKVENRGVFLAAQKFIALHPHQPRVSPQSHHQNTTTKQALFPKHPSKTL
jgi:hypothetical protein